MCHPTITPHLLKGNINTKYLPDKTSNDHQQTFKFKQYIPVCLADGYVEIATSL